jgi:hypothetical protein
MPQNFIRSPYPNLASTISSRLLRSTPCGIQHSPLDIIPDILGSCRSVPIPQQPPGNRHLDRSDDKSRTTCIQRLRWRIGSTPHLATIHHPNHQRRGVPILFHRKLAVASITSFKTNALVFGLAIAAASLLFPDSMLRNFIQSFSSSSAARTMPKLKTPPPPTLPTAIKSSQEAKLEEGSKSRNVG